MAGKIETTSVSWWFSFNQCKKRKTGGETPAKIM